MAGYMTEGEGKRGGAQESRTAPRPPGVVPPAQPEPGGVLALRAAGARMPPPLGFEAPVTGRRRCNRL